MDTTQLSGVGMVNTTVGSDTDQILEILSLVVDPEIPVLTIEDLGILRSVSVVNGGVRVTITPTYSGCPAMRQIENDITTALGKHGFDDVEVRMVHFPAWSTSWITEEGNRKLAEFGIAPPTAEVEVVCPRCSEPDPRMIARFGSTACKALMVCNTCGEPFDYFKEF